MAVHPDTCQDTGAPPRGPATQRSRRAGWICGPARSPGRTHPTTSGGQRAGPRADGLPTTSGEPSDASAPNPNRYPSPIPHESKPKARSMPQPTLPGPPRTRREGERSRHRQARTRGLRAASFVTRVVVAASVALTGAFSAIAATAFPGHATRDGTATRATRSFAVTIDAPRGAPTPNHGAGGLPAPPIQAPVPAAGTAQVGSGGS